MKRALSCIAIFLMCASPAWAQRVPLTAISGSASNQKKSKEACDKGFHAAMHGNYQEAERQFKTAIDLDPNNVGAYNDWGLTLMQLDRKSEALQKFETATKKDPKFAKAWYNWGVALAGAGDKKGAAEKFRRTTALRPDFSPAYEQWGLVLIDMGQRRQGIEKLKLAAKYDPKKTPQIEKVIKNLEKRPAKPGKR